MVWFLLRCAIAIAALASIRYSVLQQHVDVSVPDACVAAVSKDAAWSDNSCIYRDVSLRGHVMHRNFEVFGPTGIGIFAKDALIVSPGNSAGFTWRSLALLLIAVAMWIPSLLSLFTNTTRSKSATAP